MSGGEHFGPMAAAVSVFWFQVTTQGGRGAANSALRYMCARFRGCEAALFMGSRFFWELLGLFGFWLSFLG